MFKQVFGSSPDLLTLCAAVPQLTEVPELLHSNETFDVYLGSHR